RRLSSGALEQSSGVSLPSRISFNTAPARSSGRRTRYSPRMVRKGSVCGCAGYVVQVSELKPVTSPNTDSSPCRTAASVEAGPLLTDDDISQDLKTSELKNPYPWSSV